MDCYEQAEICSLKSTLWRELFSTVLYRVESKPAPLKNQMPRVRRPALSLWLSVGLARYLLCRHALNTGRGRREIEVWVCPAAKVRTVFLQCESDPAKAVRPSQVDPRFGFHLPERPRDTCCRRARPRRNCADQETVLFESFRAALWKQLDTRGWRDEYGVFPKRKRPPFSQHQFVAASERSDVLLGLFWRAGGRVDRLAGRSRRSAEEKQRQCGETAATPQFACRAHICYSP
jgi:hypothetical protein